MVDQERLNDFPKILVDVVEAYESTGSILCRASAEDIAEMWRGLFQLPYPLGMNEASCFVQNLKGIQVFLKPRLESGTRYSLRGIWFTFDGKSFVFIDAERPSPSQIRTLIHELSEKSLAISQLLHPELPEKTPRDREQWANRVAAYVKMPREKFCKQTARYQLDIEILKKENDETLGCVARHLRDLLMKEKVFYWCRFDLAPYGLTKSAELATIANEYGGTCIRVVDVAQTEHIEKGRRQTGGFLPRYNLPSYDHYRILSPVMDKYIKANQPVLFEAVAGAASETYFQGELFGEYDLCTLLVPYGKRKTRGFWMIGIHPRDRFRFEAILRRLQPEERGRIDWLFSWASYTKPRPAERPAQKEIPELGDTPVELEGMFQGEFEGEPYRWPMPQSTIIMPSSSQEIIRFAA